MKHDHEPFAEPGADWLDRLLTEPHVAPPELAGRILDDLPPQGRWQRMLDAVLPTPGEGGRWRPLAAALVPLALGFALGLGSGAQTQDPLYDDLLILAFSDSYFETTGDYGDE